MVNLNGEYLSYNDFIDVVVHHKEISITESCIEKTEKSHSFLKQYTKDHVVYGVNTGFGPMAQYFIDESKSIDLQYNLIRSHASGAGKPLPYQECRALMLARLNSLCFGYSAIHPDLLRTLQQFINLKIHPFIPQHGGVGASGDLVQLAHLALNLIGEGEIIVDNTRIPAQLALENAGIEPFQIKGREALAIMNGTSAMTGIGLLNILHAENLLQQSILHSSILNDMMASYSDHFSEELNAVKKHKGQHYIAAEMRAMLYDSDLVKKRVLLNPAQSNTKFKEKVQEYYSLRCVPQILGPIFDTIQNAKNILCDELNSVNDNPVVYFQKEEIYHGGNFHGDYVALEMDKLKLAITKMSMLAERQINYLAADYLNEKFPKFLIPDTPGFNFGIQGMQFSATSTTAENQALSSSMYIHSIPTNSDNQDVVSMGTNAALLCQKVIENTYQVMAIQNITLAHAYYIFNEKERLASKSKKHLEEMYAIVMVEYKDKPLYPYIEQIITHLKNQIRE